MLAKVALLLALCGLCYGAEPAAAKTAGRFFACYFGFIFIGMFLTVNVVHDASHNAFFRRPWANRWLNALVSVPLGLDPDCWRVRHVLFHHAHNNIEHYDPDIDANGVLRQTPFQRWRPFMRAQRLLLAAGGGADVPVLHLAVRLAGPSGPHPRGGAHGAAGRARLVRISGGQGGAPAAGAGDPVLAAAAGHRHRANPAGLLAEPDAFFIAVRDVDHRHPLGQSQFLSGAGAGGRCRTAGITTCLPPPSTG
ncbi:Fatty acid desaturase [Serratia marcescens]|uniref:Fatty acid desaturase n=1 Tax=Serratia marcescens TaxID=615 RepID=A0A379Z9S4_SERMA|nr:Fatty acid desaturase [Serratia marcescens]